MRFKSPAPVALLLPILLAGCNLFAPRQAARTPPYGAPYAGLNNKSVAIVVFVPPAIANEYTGAREEISSFIAAQVREHLPSVQLLNPQAVMNWQDDTLNWQSLSGDAIARHFNVDRVLSIEVSYYTTRHILKYSNMQGNLRALCKIYDASPAPPLTAPAWTGLVDASWPAAHPLDPTQTSESAVRLRTLESFADQLVGHFYDH